MVAVPARARTHVTVAVRVESRWSVGWTADSPHSLGLPRADHPANQGRASPQRSHAYDYHPPNFSFPFSDPEREARCTEVVVALERLDHEVVGSPPRCVRARRCGCARPASSTPLRLCATDGLGLPLQAPDLASLSRWRSRLRLCATGELDTAAAVRDRRARHRNRGDRARAVARVGAPGPGSRQPADAALAIAPRCVRRRRAALASPAPPRCVRRRSPRAVTRSGARRRLVGRSPRRSRWRRGGPGARR
jgi:hypothetical protein